MIKRLGAIAALSVGLSSLVAAPASAAECGLGGLLGSCTTTQPSSQSSPPPSSPPAEPAPAPASEAPGTIAEMPEAAARMLDMVNRERGAAGLAGLIARADVAAIAAGHSRAMAGRRDIWHNDAYFTASTRSSLRARGLGENVAMNGSVDDAHRRLMASPGHRANILNGSYDTVGIVVVHDETGGLYVTQNFVDSADPAVTRPAPTKAAKVTKARKVRKARFGRRPARRSLQAAARHR